MACIDWALVCFNFRFSLPAIRKINNAAIENDLLILDISRIEGELMGLHMRNLEAMLSIISITVLSIPCRDDTTWWIKPSSSPWRMIAY